MAQKYKEKVLSGCGFSNKKVESDYAMKLMKKMGWKEDQGLGKNQDGKKECIQITRRTEQIGLGYEGGSGFQWNDQWWEKNYSNTLVNLKPISNKNLDDETEKFDEESDLKLSKKQKKIKETIQSESNSDETSSDESVVQVIRKKIQKRKN